MITKCSPGVASSPFSEVIKVVEFDPYKIADPRVEPFKFRVEILRRSDTRKYYARIYRRETFRIQPSFPQSKGKPVATNQADHEMFVLDTFVGAEDFKSASAAETLRKVEKALTKAFAKR